MAIKSKGLLFFTVIKMYNNLLATQSNWHNFFTFLKLNSTKGGFFNQC